MNIGFVTFASTLEFRQIVAPGVKSHQEYCDIHNYNLLNDVSDVYDRTRPAAWSKISLLLKYIDKGYDWLFWIDADTIIANNSVRLQNVLLESGIKDRHQILLTRDPRGTINIGVFFVRCSEWSKKFLEKVFKHPAGALWEEQAALSELYAQNYKGAKDKIHIENRTWKFNSYPIEKITLQNRPIKNIGIYHHGDFLVHFAGIHGDELKSAMRDFYKAQHIYGKRAEENAFSNEYCGQNWDLLYGKGKSLTWLPEDNA